MVKDGSHEGYLRMQGSTLGADGYLPMVPESEQSASRSGSDMYNVNEEDDVIYLTDLQCVDYDNISQRIRLSSSGSQRSRLPSGGSAQYRARDSSTGSDYSSSGYLRPRQSGEFSRLPRSERRSARRPKDIRLATSAHSPTIVGDGDGNVETHKAEVHSSSSSSSPESTPPDTNHLSEESEDQEQHSPLEPFLSRSGSAHSSSSPTTGRRYKCGDSMTLSDTSSGFHSDYAPEENSVPTDYNTVVLGSLHRKEALV